MSPSTHPPRHCPVPHPVLVYDGDCALCTGAALWVARRWADGAPQAVAWQSLGVDGLRRLGLTGEQVATAAWWVDEDGGLSGAEAAIGRALRRCRRPGAWLGMILLTRPGAFVGGRVYPVVARHRHRLPGATPACAMRRPPADETGGSGPRR